MTVRVLIVGADGTIGSALATRLAADGLDVVTTSRRRGQHRLDLRHPPSSWPTLPRADVTVVCAAVTSIAACEADPEATATVNVAAPAAIAGATEGLVVLPSTNLVFAGDRPDHGPVDQPAPTTAYGRQKVAAERAILEAGGAVVRLTKVVGPATQPFADWRDALQVGDPVTAFDDLAVSPVPLSTVVAALTSVVVERHRGILHLSGPPHLVYADVARRMAVAIRRDEGLVDAASSAHASGLIARPVHASLDDHATRETLGLGPANADLVDVLEELRCS